MSKHLLFPVTGLLFLAGALFPAGGRAEGGFSPASVRVERSLAGLSAEGILSEAAIPPSVETEIHILLRFMAPRPGRAAERPPLSLALVFDRSGSMDDAGKLNYAIRAGKEAVRLLGPRDKLAIVQYDTTVQVLSPLAPVTDKAVLNRLLDSLTPGEYTFLSGGLQAGIAQLQKAGDGSHRRVLLLSDGLANRGLTDAGKVAAIGASARDKNISVSTLGLGLDYDENMMQLLAQRGGGQYSYIRDSEDLPAFFRQELALAAESVTRGFRLIFIPDPAVGELKCYGYATSPADRGLIVEMGDLYAGEERQVLLRARVRPGSGPTQALGMASLSFALADDSSVGLQTLELPLTVALVADEGERKEQNAALEDVTSPVREEALLLAAEEARVRAVEELQKGNLNEASAVLNQAAASLAAAPASPKIANSMASLAADEKLLAMAAAEPSRQQEMAKQSKYSLYKSSQGKSQTLFLQPGDRGAPVEKLQRLLTERGLYSGPADGLYSDDLANAVRAFQSREGLAVDGVAGQNTLRALGM
ncbi:MAG: peptidoglycan-binding protein [Deltaproteobacteria bacterium]|jgi:Ca-activated chloride channel family protein|nr:peptidoglycan-binding protein [Deltaproteobacteria bacterium]